jgi:hypothetical protein
MSWLFHRSLRAKGMMFTMSRRCVLANAGVALVLTMGASSLLAQDLPRVVIETEMGTIEVQIEVKRAPITAANFLKYVDGGFYDKPLAFSFVANNLKFATTATLRVTVPRRCCEACLAGNASRGRCVSPTRSSLTL